MKSGRMHNASAGRIKSIKPPRSPLAPIKNTAPAVSSKKGN